jgi:signal transduction histidine kinase
VALSSISEFMISRLVGGAALLALFLACMLGVFWRTEPTSAMNIAFALATVISFFGYVLQAAILREKTEAQVRTALRAAQSAQEEAAVASAAKSTFLATMSHEIRTPLNGVLGMAQAMAAEDLSPVQRERLGVIRESGEALTTILNDVLDLSKIEAGQLEIETVTFDLDHLLHQSRAAFLHLADQKGLELTLSLEAAASGVYLGDPARLRQVIYNLLSNAVKFTEAGEVQLRARREDGLLHLSVADTGVGVAADQLDRLFAKFVQLDASMSRRHGGTGLGLAISRELCRAMGGDIAVESAAGQGSTFTLRLPLERVGESAPAAMAPTTSRSVALSPRNLPTRNCQRATGLERMLTIVFLPSSWCSRLTPSTTAMMTPNSDTLIRLKSFMYFT